MLRRNIRDLGVTIPAGYPETQIAALLVRLEGLPLLITSFTRLAFAVGFETACEMVMRSYRCLMVDEAVSVVQRAEATWGGCSPNDQALLKQMSVFAAGATASALVSVDSLSLPASLDALQSKGVLARLDVEPGAPRYRVPGPLREVVSSALEQSHWRRHALHYLGRVLRYCVEAPSTDDIRFASVESANIAQAIRVTRACPSTLAERCKAFVASVYQAELSGDAVDETSFAELADTQLGELGAEARGEFLLALALFRRRKGEYAQSKDNAERALALACTDTQKTKAALALGHALRLLGDRTAAAQHYEQSNRYAVTTKLIAASELWSAVTAFEQGFFPQAVAFGKAAAARFRTTPTVLRPFARGIVAMALMRAGDKLAGIPDLDIAISEANQIGANPLTLAYLQVAMGEACLLARQPARAWTHLERGLALAQPFGAHGPALIAMGAASLLQEESTRGPASALELLLQAHRITEPALVPLPMTELELLIALAYRLDGDELRARAWAKRAADNLSGIDAESTRKSAATCHRVISEGLGRELKHQLPPGALCMPLLWTVVQDVNIGSAEPTRLLRVQRDGEWFEFALAARVNLRRRKALRALLRSLALNAVHNRGVDEKELIARGWCGEKMSASAARHRLRTALSTLRKLGMGATIERVSDGYRLSSDVEVRLVP